MNDISNGRFRKNSLASLLILALLAGVAFPSRPLAGAEPTAPAVSLQIYSARVTRASTELNKRFPGRNKGDGNPGVSLTLVLALKEGTMLPAGRESVSLDTFVDDTYKSLRLHCAEVVETVQVPFTITTGIGL